MLAKSLQLSVDSAAPWLQEGQMGELLHFIRFDDQRRRHPQSQVGLACSAKSQATSDTDTGLLGISVGNGLHIFPS